MVGDFNVAVEPRDVHTAINYPDLYDQEEVGAMRDLLGVSTLRAWVCRLREEAVRQLGHVS